MIILFILALFLATIAHFVFDRHKEVVHSPIVHWQSAGLVIVVSIMIGFITQGIIDFRYQVPKGFYRWWQFTIFSLTIHFCFFDLIWNVLHGYAWDYHGTPTNPNRAWTDRLWERLPPWGEIFLRLWVPAVGYGVYFCWDLIVGK